MKATQFHTTIVPILALFGSLDQAIVNADGRIPIRARSGMVVSSSGIATKAGLEILKQGGNAVDAAVTTAFVLAVTLPSAGNIGGGG
ncbi:MAG TPA: gamma-glutamyltransferase, partial [Verrucomicrobia bacterium]|nr:gamma-glutamyltransferase [Verrucomicrobiota bacterium]